MSIINVSDAQLVARHLTLPKPRKVADRALGTPRMHAAQ